MRSGVVLNLPEGAGEANVDIFLYILPIVGVARGFGW